MKRHLKKLPLLIFVFTSLVAHGQELIISKAPENYQLYARDETDSADVEISGKLGKGSTVKGLSLKVLKDGASYDLQEVSVKENTFSLTTRIDAGLHQFRFELYIQRQGKDSLYMVADSVVCGDAYIITGQSNSHPSSLSSTYSSTYCRSFGVKTGYKAYTEEDKKVRWGRATGNCPGLKNDVGGWGTSNPLGVGVWGMELSSLIVEKHKIPVCIINGGSGASSIEQNMLYPEQSSLETSFGRLAYRVDQARLKDKVKAIFWHQGESNSNDDGSFRTYFDNFNQLQADWRRVYTGLKKIYLFQLHPGCGRTTQGYGDELREIQTQIAGYYDMVEIMSTTGVKGHDGCHFSYEGYLEFAERIFPLVSRDFYGEKTEKIITAPQLLSAKYTSGNTLTLTFDQPISIEEKREVGGEVRFLKDQFFFKNDPKGEFLSVQVESLEANENMVHIGLASNSSAKYVTYLPSKFYIGTKERYNGPWLTGSKNKIGALSFHLRPIIALKSLSKNDPFVAAGYQVLDSTFNGVDFKLVSPKKIGDKKRWIWRARFWGHEPQTDLALLKKGFHVAYIDVAGLYGSEKAIRIWDGFYEFVTNIYALNPKVVLEGMSRGGLIVFNWANRNAEKVACIYVDAPVCDIKSWPARIGRGTGSAKQWEEVLIAYGFTEEVALKFSGNPVSHLENLASQKVPILSVVGDADEVVPVSENTELVEKRLQELGWKMEIIHKPGIGHHPHSLENPKPIVDFITKSTKKL